MAYHICEIKADRTAETAITELLNQYGASGTAVEGASLIRASIEAGNAEIWDESQIGNTDPMITIKGFFLWEIDMDEVKPRINAGIAVFEAVLGTEISSAYYDLRDEDWQDSWKQYYKPFRVGEHFVIKPTWEEYSPQEGDEVIELDPGLAFGTGNHPTTGGALQLIEKYVKQGMKVIDCGCGSGILAVAAAKRGADRVYAVDIDHDAVLASVKNLRLNGLVRNAEVFCADVTKRDFSRIGPFDVAVANIVADVIIPMLTPLEKITVAGSILIAGGIIAHRKDEVFAALDAHHFEIKEVLQVGDWITLAAVKSC